MTERQHGEPPPTGEIQRHPDAPAPGSTIASHYRMCVGCGPDHPTGLHVTVVAGEGLTVAGTFTVTDDHQGAPGLAHGGILSLAFDEVLGSLIWLIGKPAVTGHLETSYRRPVPVGTTLHIGAAVDRGEGRKIFMSAVGRENAPDGPVSVTASAVFVVVPPTHFTDHGRPVAASELSQAAAKVAEVNP
ncbi:PaaI family thioesterase [Jiangella alkaliphila]|uniref:Acyl-coenzyme A thioesterase THEM4 n=1 Tax=Jiangella alkaliphila TaxID=419479 RepID=A0A1H2L107_9ACTN|nr:PaaI family thioesterase [Jiangella alkaliphila]SDU74308.1 Predicted thioesterase [Jiangella alkaliphila]